MFELMALPRLYRYSFGDWRLPLSNFFLLRARAVATTGVQFKFDHPNDCEEILSLISALVEKVS